MAILQIGRTMAIKRGGTILQEQTVRGAQAPCVLLVVDNPGVGWFYYSMEPTETLTAFVTETTIVGTVLKR